MDNLQKIFWVALVVTILAWVGVGVYYLSTIYTSQAPVALPPQATILSPVQPTKPAVSLESLGETHFIVGNFQGWEEIEGFQDRYILLTNPETKRNYPKIKVVLGSDPYESYQFWEGITVFSVENSEGKYDSLGYLKDFTSEEIDKLIKKGDLIKVVFEKESMIKKFEENSEDLEVKNLKDIGDDFLALSLSIKRTEGKTAIEKELGREIQGL